MPTPTQTAALQIADAFYNLSNDERDDLHTDGGLIVDVDGVKVAVWHRTDDNKIVSFTNPNHPDDGEQWAEVDAPETRYHVFVTDAAATNRASDNTSPWSVPEGPMTKDELTADLHGDLEATDIEWDRNEVHATITNPNTDERERVIFVLDEQE